MSGDEELIKFTAVLDAFAAAQREQGLAQVKRQRLVLTEPVGDRQIHFETLVDEGATAVEIYEALAPLDGAIDRLRAKAELALLYGGMVNKCGQIEQAVQKLQDDAAKFQRENTQRNENRRLPVMLTDQQRASLEHHRDNIRDLFLKIEEDRKAAEECMRVIEGLSRFTVLDEQITARLDALRGQRPDAA